MKGTEHFKQIIKSYLDNRAEQDELFSAKYEAVNRPIEDIVTYIIGEVHKMGVYGLGDEDVYSLAVHAAEEADLEIGKTIACDIVVNQHIELTEAEKAEQKAMALKRYQDEELKKLQARSSKPKAKPQVEQAGQSLFDL